MDSLVSNRFHLYSKLFVSRCIPAGQRVSGVSGVVSRRAGGLVRGALPREPELPGEGLPGGPHDPRRGGPCELLTGDLPNGFPGRARGTRGRRGGVPTGRGGGTCTSSTSRIGGVSGFSPPSVRPVVRLRFSA